MRTWTRSTSDRRGVIRCPQWYTGDMDNKVTAHQLLALKPGTRLRVKKNDAELLVELLDNPRLEPIGKPGLHRVRMKVCGALTPKPMAAGMFSPFSTQRGQTVNGAQVLEIMGV